MDVDGICMTAAFMWGGVKEDDMLLAHWDQGCVELCSEVTQFAALSESYLRAVFCVIENDFPGVYEYEVSESFGQWCREHIESQPPASPMTSPSIDKHAASLELAELVYGFFTNRCGRDYETLQDLRCALNDVRDNYLHHLRLNES